MHYQSLTDRTATPLHQIGTATWPAALGVILSISLVVTASLITNGKETNTNIWTANAAVIVAVGGIVLKGSLATLVGIALYHRLWLQLGQQKDRKAGQSKAGLTVQEIESHHLASRLAVGMLVEPSQSLAWTCGVLCLLLTSALVPMLQYGMDVVVSSDIRPTTVPIQHAQLDSRMALRSGAAGLPDNVSPNVLRAATRALFGADAAFVYTERNLTGLAVFSDVQYADVECNIKAVPGDVRPTSRSDWYYNFTFETTTPPSSNEPSYGSYNYLYALRFTSTMNNKTHYLQHDCQLRAAAGTCSIYLTNGAGLTKDLRCERADWLTEEQLPNTTTSPAVGFFAIVTAFVELFRGESYTSATQGRPQQNSTFVAATAGYFDRDTIGMPPDLLSHVQRTLWHTAINARPVGLPEADIGGDYDLDSTVEMLVQDESPILLVSVNFLVIATVLGMAVVIAVLALLYLIMANNSIPGRLMRDSLVHTLTVAAHRPGDGQSVSVIDPGNTSQHSLEHVLRRARKLRLEATLANDANDLDGGPKLVLECKSSEDMIMHTRSILVQPQKSSPLISRNPSPRSHPPSATHNSQTRPPSISPEPSIYRYESADFADVSRQYRIDSEPDLNHYIPAQYRSEHRDHGYYTPPRIQCKCSNPEHHH